MENKEDLKALVIIVNAGFSDEAMDIAVDCGAGGGTIINARGSGSHQKLILGMHVGPEKEIIMSIVKKGVAEKIMQEIKDKKGINTPMNGICFYMPVDQMTQINKIESQEE